MTVNGSAPASVSATEGKGRKTDQLDGSITSKNNVHADANQDRRRDLVPLEAAAAELELSPFWLRQRLRACGIEEIWLQRVGYIRLADLKALKEADQETKKRARAIQSAHFAQQRQEGRGNSRLTHKDHLDIMRRRDPDLRRLNGGAI